MNRNVAVLTLAQTLAFSMAPALTFIGTIIGSQMAPSKQLATLPLSLMIVGTAFGAYPLVSLMKRLGRKPVFMASTLMISGCCVLLSFALYRQSFVLFCLASALVGVGLAALQQFRFAAMESVAVSAMPTAASTVMLAGVVAAFIGPELVLLGQKWSSIEFFGSFLLLGVCYLVCTVILFFYHQPAEPIGSSQSSEGSMAELFSSPLFVLSLSAAGVGFIVMSFIMIATPISMHEHAGHSLADTKWVIQSHVAAMFLPSLVLPLVIRLLGVQWVIALGIICYGLTVLIGLLGVGVWSFWFALVFLGVGWNFLFVGATTLLPQAVKPELHFKAQAVNDSVVFSLQAFAAMSSGVVLNLWGWQAVLWVCLPVMLGQLLLQLVCYKRHCSLVQ